MNRKSWIIIGALACVGIGAGAFLLKQSAEPNPNVLGRPLAVLREINNEVRYKYARDFFWRDGALGKKVYDGSQIFVGPKSSALLVFAENHKLRLNEETLLRISQVEQNPALIALQINDGGFNLKSGKGASDPLVLNLDDGKFKILSKDEYDIYLKKNGKKLSLSVAQGKISLQNVQGKTDLLPGNSIVLETGDVIDGGVSKKQVMAKELPAITFTLISPQDGEIIHAQQAQPLFFKWEASDTGSLRLQYSSEPDFGGKMTEVDVKDQQLFPIPLENLNGDIFWRLVSYKDNVPVYSKTSFFKVGQAGSVLVQMSQPAYVRKGVWKIQASIAEDDEKTNYDFQVSKDSTFTKLHDAYLGKSPFTSLLDSDGTYFVRARKNFGNGTFSPWSSSQQVTIRPSLAAPVAEIVDRKEDRVGNVITGLKWSEVANAVQYTVQTSDAAAFTHVTHSKTVMTTESAVQHSSPNKVYYRIIANSTEGEASTPSNILVSEGSTILQEEQAKLAEEKSAADKAKEKEKASLLSLTKTDDSNLLLLPSEGSVFYTGDDIKFEWDPVFADPTVEISNVANFSQDVTRLVAKKKSSMTIKALNQKGRYYWRLSYQGFPGKNSYTRVQSFNISQALSTQIEKLSRKIFYQ